MAIESPEQPLDGSDVPNAESAGRTNTQGLFAMGPVLGLLFALVAGGLAWGIHQAVEPIFLLPEEYNFDFGPPNDEVAAAAAAAQRSVDLGNRVFATTLIGALLGAAFGVAEGVARRSRMRTLLYAAGCGLGAALLGGLGGAGGHFTQLSREAMEQRLSLPSIMIVQCVLWASLGAGVGLTFGALAGRLGTVVGCLFAGLAAGALGAVLYVIVVSLLIPSAQPQYLIPFRHDVQLVWIACPVILLGLMLPWAARQNKKPH